MADREAFYAATSRETGATEKCCWSQLEAQGDSFTKCQPQTGHDSNFIDTDTTPSISGQTLPSQVDDDELTSPAQRPTREARGRVVWSEASDEDDSWYSKSFALEPDEYLAKNAGTATNDRLCTSDEPLQKVPNDVSTIMIRNIPAHVSRRGLLKELGQLGFDGRYDYVHLPMAFGSGRNKGFAFVNFLNARTASEFVGLFPETPPDSSGKDQGWRVAPAAVQGFGANAAVAESRKMSRIRKSRYKPLVFSQASR